ncbi:DUF1932 domain-containing protein [Streptomyces meridianus]|nr:DUF1932 domain-containing protein [Streptomyces meridianus]
MRGVGTTVGILHPGRMGAAVAAQLRRGGARVIWSPEGRSPATAERAEAARLEAADGLADLLERADVVLSLCSPAAAENVARQVAEHGVENGTLYIEANATAPRRMQRIVQLLPGASVVDAALIGPPPVNGKRPLLYASGPPSAVSRLSGLFAMTDVQVRPLGEEIGKASALGLSHSGYRKAAQILAALAHGVAEQHGVARQLTDIAAQEPGGYPTRTAHIPDAAANAWRWAPELQEVADLFAEAGLPDELMRGAAASLGRWEQVRDAELSAADALEKLRTPTEANADGTSGTA